MNERIKELEMQVARSFDPLKDWDCSEQEYAAEFNRRFAELIVRECANLFEIEYGTSEVSGNEVARVLQRHFGVKEYPSVT